MEAPRQLAHSLGHRWLSYSRTRSGIVVNLLAVFVAAIWIGLLASAPQQSGGSVVFGAVVGIPVAWGIAWLVVALAARGWEGRTQPATPAFARKQVASSGSA